MVNECLVYYKSITEFLLFVDGMNVISCIRADVISYERAKIKNKIKE
jgi:hypothetical protein